MSARSAVARANPDGYTLLMSGSPTHSVGPHLFKNLTYDPMRDVPPVAMVGIAPNLLVVNASLAGEVGGRSCQVGARASPDT